MIAKAKLAALATIHDQYLEHKNEIIAKAAMIPGFLFAQRMILASDLELATNLGTTSSNILSNISHLYCDSLCWLCFTIQAVILIFFKNEKAIALAKFSLVGCLIVYVVLKVMGTDGGILARTGDSIADWLGAGGQ